MVLWRERPYEGLNPSEVNDVWKYIIGQIERGRKRVQICRGTGAEVPQFKNAAEKYVHEVVRHLEEVLELPVDAHRPPVQPWD
jgi:hypothetical protein